VGDGVVVVSVEVEEFTDLGEGEGDKRFMGRFTASALAFI
jgi:hypothetical protein